MTKQEIENKVDALIIKTGCDPETVGPCSCLCCECVTDKVVRIWDDYENSHFNICDVEKMFAEIESYDDFWQVASKYEKNDPEASLELVQREAGELPTIYVTGSDFFNNTEVKDLIESELEIEAAKIKFIEKEMIGGNEYRYIFRFKGDIETAKDLREQYEYYYAEDMPEGFESIEHFRKAIDSDMRVVHSFDSGDCIMEPSGGEQFLLLGWYPKN